MHNLHITADTVVHDQNHLEVCLNYPIQSAGTEHRFYKTDFYFFVPRVMAISPNSYPREQFYQDVTNYTRIHTPDVPHGEMQLLDRIAEAINDRLDKKEPEESLEEVIRLVKIFGNTVNKKLKQGNPVSEIAQMIAEYRERCVQSTEKQTLLIPFELRKVIRLVDEYLSNRIETVLVEADSKVQDSEIRKFLDQELGYRQHRKRNFVVDRSTDSEREYFFFRQNLLKKVVALPLFLEAKKKKLDNSYRNWVASFGAALAASWSQFAEHHAYKATNASDFGFQFIAVAMFAIGVYVFKDRIKDLSKEYVNEKLRGHIPDLKGTLSNLEFGITGRTQEYVRYVDEKIVPAEVSFLRRLGGRWDVEPPFQDTVLHYYRSVELKSAHWENVSIKDILRFNFSFFLKHLDDPIKQFTSYDQEDGIMKMNFPKVYHLNVVVKMEEKEGNIAFETYRLVFNRTGIIRMESIAEKKTLLLTKEMA